ncbi:MAG TPA: sugar transferase [Thermomicrobiales bacterium]|nr:sugar transferase [Thermomicrobiales bacterium]
MGATIGLVATSWIILPAYWIARMETGLSGFFVQERVGQHGKIFRVIKIRTMRPMDGIDTSVTTGADPRITCSGRFFRRTKIDELPQLINVLMGEMSFVGPRPDVPGFADSLQGDDRLILSVRPGITGPATLHFRDEEVLLAQQSDPERFNREVIYPEKVRLNRQYVENYRFIDDLKFIWQTIFK